MAGVFLFLAPASCIGLIGGSALQAALRTAGLNITQRLIVEAGLVTAGILGLAYGKNTVRPGSSEPNWCKLLLWGSLVSIGFFTFLSGGGILLWSTVTRW